ncbi:TIGR03085 family metal-binding protein [Nesterenkonia muleiensis]|uniref:TIGR03085 family metal-binding protein n=1 Tax=Nesterenkonia muleiensis TaxID=2282648 RepID=UPI0013007350|nr:TIGR03085 family metal-binding protein [Nesterenkonia muleiensis]
MAHPAAQERQALSEALRGVAADAPTLCEGWDARDLAVHIVVRDSRPDLLSGERLPVVGGRARAALEELKRTDYQTLVDRVAAGPPRWSPTRLRAVDNLANTVEFYVHTEDVLRAQQDFDPNHRRDIRPDVRAQLWKQGAQGLFLLAARSQHQRITFISPHHGAVTRGRTTDPLCVIQGPPEENVLWAFGRRGVAAVDLTAL